MSTEEVKGWFNVALVLVLTLFRPALRRVLVQDVDIIDP